MEKTQKLYVGSVPEPLVARTLKLQEERIQENRKRLLDKIRRMKFKYYCSVCLIIRDENEYLEEWLKWHISQGVEHFYIYDHQSRQSVNKFIKSLGSDIDDKVTVIEWSEEHKDAQPDAYNDCLTKYKTESQWIGFIDSDEQVRVKTGRTLPEFLKGYENFAGLFAVWIIYNANGQIKKTSGTLRERFTRVSRGDNWANCSGKVFVQPMLMREMVIHSGLPEFGFDLVDEHKNRRVPYSLVSDNATCDLICVDHYYTKSYEEWMQKLERGSGHAKYQRKYSEFFKVNPEMEYCREDIKLVQKYHC